MKKANKILSVILALMMVISIIPLTASAETPTSGVCGKNATWEFDEIAGTLTISGEGPMYDYYYSRQDEVDTRPWAPYDDLIEFVIIEDGITYIGEYAFVKFNLLTIVTIPESVTKIGEYAFNSTEPMVVHYKGTESQWNNVTIVGSNSGLYYKRIRFYFVDFPVSDSGTWHENITWSFDAETLTLTISGTGIMNADFGEGGYHLNRKQFRGHRGWDYYKYHIERVVITDGVTQIGGDVFRYHPNLKEVIIPNSIQTIDIGALDSGESLSDIYYSGTEEDWNNINIRECSLLGKPNSSYKPNNATIHYNYVPPFTGIKDDYFYKDDVKQKAYQLVEFDGDFYFINDYNKIAKNKRIYLSDRFVNGFTYEDGTPLKVGYYEFDENGKMIIHNGVVGDYLYKNNERLKAYQLVEFGGDFYFINDSHKVAKNKTLYLSDRFVNGFTYEDGTPLKAGYYTFDENGKMVMLNGPVGDYFYENNVRLNAYQLVEFEGDYYFINNSNKLAKNTRIYLSQRFVEGTDLKVGYYNFDADGKLIIE